jgi:hypothetical protein
MKNILLITMLLMTGASVRATSLYLVGEEGQLMGCVSCNEYGGDSIWNEYSTYGNEYNYNSIWNDYGTYGNEYNFLSPWNEYGQGMKVIDMEGNYYGRFTTNAKADQTEVPLLKSILDAYATGKWKTLEAFRNWVAPQIY